MILAKISGAGRSMIVIGLSGENVTRLAAGEPILKKLDDAGVEDTDLVVMYGKTEDDIVADLDTLLERMGVDPVPPELRS